MAPRKFIRTDSHRFSKLGKNRPKLQVWRKPKGRHNKMREKRFGYPVVPSVGYKKQRSQHGLIHGKNPVVVYNTTDVERASKHDNVIVIIGKVGAKKKLDIVKKAAEKHVPILNVSGGLHAAR